MQDRKEGLATQTDTEAQTHEMLEGMVRRRNRRSYKLERRKGRSQKEGAQRRDGNAGRRSTKEKRLEIETCMDNGALPNL